MGASKELLRLCTLCAKTPPKVFNPFMPGGLFCPYKLEESICQLRGGWFSSSVSALIRDNKILCPFQQYISHIRPIDE